MHLGMPRAVRILLGIRVILISFVCLRIISGANQLSNSIYRCRKMGTDELGEEMEKSTGFAKVSLGT